MKFGFPRHEMGVFPQIEKNGIKTQASAIAIVDRERHMRSVNCLSTSLASLRMHPLW